MLIGADRLLVLVPRDTARHHHPGDRLEREVGLSLRRLDHRASTSSTYGLSGLFAAGAALYLTTQTGAGSPTIGKDYILPSVAAAVIGGVSLFGGRGHLARHA